MKTIKMLVVIRYIQIAVTSNVLEFESRDDAEAAAVELHNRNTTDSLYYTCIILP